MTPGAAAEAHRRAVYPTRLAVEQLTVALADLLGCGADEAVVTRDRVAGNNWQGMGATIVDRRRDHGHHR